MEKLITFNNKVKELLGVDIHYNLIIQNFKVNGRWVTDINYYHFNFFENTFIKLIDTYINRDSEKEVIFLKNIQKDLKENYRFLSQIDFDNIRNYCSFLNYQFPDDPPVHNSEDLAEATPGHEEGRENFIFEILLNYLEVDPEEDNDLREKTFEEINELLKEKGLDVDELYGKAHLMIIISYQLELIQKVINYIQSYLDTLAKMGINYWDKEEEEELEYNNSSKQLHFNMLKKEVAMFFHTFHQLGLIHGDIENKKITETRMKQFFSSGEFYYVDVSKNLQPIIDLNKEFGGLYKKGDKPNKISDNELKYLQDLIERLQDRRDTLENEKEAYMERQKGNNRNGMI